MKTNIREVIKDDYDQIRELHKKFNLKILNESDWIKFWYQNPHLLESKTYTPVGWVIEDNNNIVGYLGNLVKEYNYKEPPEYIGFQIGQEFVVGYGMDLNQKGRDLKNIYKSVIYQN